MQKIGLFITSLILSGCLAATDDLDGYFDSVDPSPTIRTTTAPPLPAPAPSSGSQITTAPLPTGDQPTTPVATDPNNTQTAGDRRLINTSAAPPPELVDNPVAAPAEADSPRVDPATVDTSVKALGTRTQTIDLREYARSQRHLVGEKKYARNPARYKDGGNCANYSVPEVAQTAFLSEGGPQRDKLLLDRDGDGFACGWTPAMVR